MDCLIVSVVSQMLSPGSESAFFNGAGNGVVEKQSDYASYGHARRQQHGEYLIDFCNTWETKWASYDLDTLKLKLENKGQFIRVR